MRIRENNHMDICVRSMRTEEIPVCVSIIRDAFATVAEEFGITPENAPRFTAFATNEERLSWHLNHEKRIMRVASDGEMGQVAGYYSVHKVAETVCELNNLAVLPDFRHRGIGGMLLLDAFRIAKDLKCSKMQIGIVEENQILRKWYEDAGFVHIGVEKLDFFPFTCGYMEIIL